MTERSFDQRSLRSETKNQYQGGLNEEKLRSLKEGSVISQYSRSKSFAIGNIKKSVLDKSSRRESHLSLAQKRAVADLESAVAASKITKNILNATADNLRKSHDHTVKPLEHVKERSLTRPQSVVHQRPVLSKQRILTRTGSEVDHKGVDYVNVKDLIKRTMTNADIHSQRSSGIENAKITRNHTHYRTNTDQVDALSESVYQKSQLHPTDDRTLRKMLEFTTDYDIADPARGRSQERTKSVPRGQDTTSPNRYVRPVSVSRGREDHCLTPQQYRAPNANHYEESGGRALSQVSDQKRILTSDE